MWSRLTLIPSPLAVSDARIAVAMPPSTLTEQTQVGELPLEIVALVLLCLPLDARLRAREVSQDWRALLNEPRFWLVLDFSPGSGVVAPLTRALLFAAGERGRGHLCTLELTDADNLLEAEDLVQFVATHSQSLLSVTTPEWPVLEADLVTRLCLSAPLCTLHCRVDCAPAEALPLLRCEAPYALVHIFKLLVDSFENNEQAVRDLAAALPSHSGKIRELIVHNAPLRNGAVFDALVHGIAEARVSNLTFFGCHLATPSLPGLTRLLEAGCLERLVINNRHEALFERDFRLTAFCNALRSSTLQALNLRSVRLWQDPAAADELMAALVGHPTLRELSLHDSVGGVRGAQTYAWAPSDDELIAAVRQRLLNKLCGNGTGMSPGGQLASLITHNSALQKLDLSGNNLGEDGLGLIIYVLPRSSTLKEFVYHVSYEDEFISREFARSVILPAVCLNISLRRLDFGPYGETLPELAEAQAIVAARTQDAGYHRCLRWF